MLSRNEHIVRKSMLCKTNVEYGDYTMNHALGCSHGCKYPCYAYLMKRRFGQIESYEDWIKPRIVANTLELLDKEIPKMKDKIKIVQLCFCTDPFMYGNRELRDLSIKSIEKLNENNIPCSVLTKGTLPLKLSSMSKDNVYGITLISLNENYRKKVEPGAAPYKRRIESLKKLHEKGCQTWVSIEPYPTPNLINQDLSKILSSVSFVDKIIFGRTNYNKAVSSYKNNKEFYNECAYQVIDFCKNNNIDCHIKQGTISKLNNTKSLKSVG